MNELTLQALGAFDAKTVGRETTDPTEGGRIHVPARTLEIAGWLIEIERARAYCEELRVRLLAESKPAIDVAPYAAP